MVARLVHGHEVASGSGQAADSIIRRQLATPCAFMCREILNREFIATPVHKDTARDLQLLFSLFERHMCRRHSAGPATGSLGLRGTDKIGLGEFELLAGLEQLL